MRDGLRAQLTQRTGDRAVVALAALLMIGSALVHVHLWDIAYRHVATLGPLFLVQAVGAVAVALALALTRLVALAVLAVLLMVGTVGGFILADTAGLFGFTLPAVTGWAYEALVTELVSSALLVVVLIRHARRAGAVT